MKNGIVDRIEVLYLRSGRVVVESDECVMVWVGRVRGVEVLPFHPIYRQPLPIPKFYIQTLFPTLSTILILFISWAYSEDVYRYTFGPCPHIYKTYILGIVKNC